MFEFTELDLRQPNPARKAEGERTDRLIFEMGQVMPECSCTVRKQATENKR